MPDVAVFDMPAVFETIDEVREHVDNPDFLSNDVAGYTGMPDMSF